MWVSKPLYDNSVREGDRTRAAIVYNVNRFRAVASRRGVSFSTLQNAAVGSYRRVPEAARWQMRGLADGAQVPFEDLLAYNLFVEIVEPDACSVVMVLPDVTADGSMLFMKNSDKQGSPMGAPDQWHLNKEINIVRIVEPDADLGTNRVIGVAAAGQTIFKMGLSDKGVAGGASLGRIKKSTGESQSYWLAAGRGELLRDGLLYGASAQAAAARALPQLLTNPVASPGNVQFCDPTLAVNLECSFDELAAEWLTEGFLVRTNCFNLMAGLNRGDDVSSPMRRDRGMAFLAEHQGRIDVESMKDVSMDHTNGPSLSSICRHGDNWQDETSLSSAIIQVPRSGAGEAVILIALGKPCHAWGSAEGEGWIRLHINSAEADIPKAFLTGETWKRYYSEEPASGPLQSLGGAADDVPFALR
jgi:isopenicillin-N N-acyltransferase like protein